MRKLASIRIVSEIRPVVGADRIECAVVDGWTVVVKKGEYKAGDRCVFVEIDSWVPCILVPHLYTKEAVFNGIAGVRIKSTKIRGQLSQGILFPINYLSEELQSAPAGTDVTDYLKIQKWEEPPTGGSQTRGHYPARVPKTDQERVQNLKVELAQWKEDGVEFQLTEKLDGTSATFWLDGDDLHVCSRNLDLREGNDVYWHTARKLNLKEKMANGLEGIALQGEIIGPNIQGNKYKLTEPTFFLFDAYDAETGRYLAPKDVEAIAEELGINHVPVLGYSKLDSDNPMELVKLADGRSEVGVRPKREGIVLKALDSQRKSFKMISNEWLIKCEA